MVYKVKEVTADLLIRANAAAAAGPRGYENSMISIVQALSKNATPKDLLAATFRLQALANLHRGADDIAGLTMSVHGKEYKLINETAFKAAAACPLSLADNLADIQFDREEFLQLVLSLADPDGTA